ncbi:complex I NDUFA9 subunit family protein [Halomicroarcula sp. F27]|uniref:Complex I NDUFA9 subunit family protein n=1 Tax=Haloarcula nitratireducens TaxID=2487749 RepID=A0AAW4PB22_9EURY|nr:complex I NDUFA9 subunit family protein [Halomicroarcula nitratireducens]
MRILLLGGTGFVGRRLAARLVDRDHDVTALARSPDATALPDGVRTVAGDVTDPDSLDSAFDGQDAVVNLVALSPLFEPDGGSEMHEKVHLGGTENAVAAAERHGVPRFVQLSALGADPDGTTHYIRSKGQAESVVRDSSLSWTIVRPSVVFGDGGEFVSFTRLLTTPYITGLPGGGTTRFQPIWVEDLAEMLADCVTDGSHAGETHELGGPDVLTLADVARAIYRADGKSLRVLPVPTTLAKIGLTVGGSVPGFPMGPDQYRSLQFDNTVEENDVSAFGRTEADLRALEEHLDEGGERSGDRRRSLLTRPATLALFAYFALSTALPTLTDSPLAIALYVPTYLLTIAVYDAPWGLENVVYGAESLLGIGHSSALYHVGLLVTYFACAVALTWLGRSVRSAVGSRRG